MAFVEKVREKHAAGVPLEKAVSEAVDECISEGVLADFFREHREEIVEMGIFEFDQELHDQALREDGYDEGKADGYDEGKADGYKEGEADGIKKGKADGYKKGEADGIKKGKADGFADGVETCGLIYQQVQSGNTDNKAIAGVCGCSVEAVEEIRRQFGI